MMRLPVALLCLMACGEASPGDETDTDTDAGPAWDCEPDSRAGSAGRTDGLVSAGGVAYTVRTAADYDPTVAHPLLMVYAPAGGDPIVTEQFTGLTPDATGRGMVVAYADHVTPRTVQSLQVLADIVGEVEDGWCIDRSRVYLTGHSDGGTADHVIAAFEQLGRVPAAIAPSAAGIDTTTLTNFTCPSAPVPAFVMHSRADSLFPVSRGFGRGAAEWWASCNGCDPAPGAPDDAGCIHWTGCMDAARVAYCENAGSHGSWPRINQAMLDFLESSGG
jgi:polyhydroxybutyrate depolymerase